MFTRRLRKNKRGNANEVNGELNGCIGVQQNAKATYASKHEQEVEFLSSLDSVIQEIIKR